MKISYNWLIELTGLDWSPEKVAERLTLCGTACEDIVATGKKLNKVVVGKVLDLQAVEGADKIRLARVDVGSEQLDIICGAPNVAVDQKVPVALIGAKLGDDFEIKKVKIRGVTSYGMICSRSELGITDDHSGIWVLEPDAIVGRPLVEHLGYDDYILDFELTPDRADSMSAFGIARDLAALASTKVKYPEFKIQFSKESASDHISVAIDDPKACPRFTARIIRNVKLGPSPWWIQKKLLSCGMRPISNVVDITNLVMLETGNPVHAFDLDRFGSDRVLVRRAALGEHLTTLDGKDHKLTPDVLLITNGKKAKAAAGVMGGSDSEVSDTTTSIMLEVAYFNPSVIRKSRKQLGLASEASIRFEKGVDPNKVPDASARVAYLFQTVCGGEVLDGIVDCYPTPIVPPQVEFRPERCNTILGTNISADRMHQIFHDLEFDVTAGPPMKVTAPTFRHDINEEVDLIEEVARIEGFDSIVDSIENIGPLFTPTHIEDRFDDQLRSLLTGSGFDEIVGHGLADSRQAKWLDPKATQLRIINPVSEELNIMRNSLVLTGLTSVSHNIAHRNVDLAFFEIGKTYYPPNEAGEWREDDRLMLLVTGNTDTDWRQAARPYDFYDLSGAIVQLGAHFGWAQLGFKPIKQPSFEDDLSFAVLSGEATVGKMGKIRPEILRKFDIKQPVYVAELSIPDLIEQSVELKKFRPLPVFPAAPRDLAIVIDESVPVGDILDLVRSTAGELAESVGLFDFYQGKQIASGKKSVGVAIVYRAVDRSLASTEVDKLQGEIVSELRDRFRAEIRDR